METLGAGNADDRVVPGGRGLAPIGREKQVKPGFTNYLPLGLAQ